MLSSHCILIPLAEIYPVQPFIPELQGRKAGTDVENEEFLVDGIGYLTSLAQTDLSGYLNYSNQNIFEKLF